MADFRFVWPACLAIALLSACTGTTGGSGEAGPAGAPAPASGGLGVNAAGGLLAATHSGRSPATIPSRMTGRLLQGPYLILLGTDDIKRARRAAITAFENTPSGQTTIWRNPANGHWGTLTPLRTYQDANGRFCRDYRQTVTIGGQEHQGNGSACREPDGGWRIMT